MRTKLITLTTAGLLAVGGAALAVPALADTDSTDPAPDATSSSQADRITEALAGLVEDGSLTQEQVDEVAATLDAADLGDGDGGWHDGWRGGWHGGWHGGSGDGQGLKTAATALDMTEDDLRTALQAEGATLASVAEEQGVAVETLVDALVAAARERVTQALADGDLTQEQADERLADLEAWITERVDSTWGDRWQRWTERGDDATD